MFSDEECWQASGSGGVLEAVRIAFIGHLVAVGTALQNILDSDGLEELATNLIGAPGTVADGVVNGGYGPNLLPLLPALQAIPGATAAFAPGLIQNPGYIYGLIPGGIGIKPTSAITVSVLPPGTIAVLQELVERVLGALPSNQMVSTFSAPAGGQDLKIAGNDLGGVTTANNSGGTELDGTAAAEGPEVTPKKHRQRVELNVLKLNPLDPNSKGKDASEVGSDGGTAPTTAKHQPGIGMTPVRDLVKKVLGGQDDQKDSSAGANTESAAS